jgi:hypothetical protein
LARTHRVVASHGWLPVLVGTSGRVVPQRYDHPAMPCPTPSREPQFLHLKAAASETAMDPETLREHCRKGWVHAHKIGGVWHVEVTAQGFPADAPASCSCTTPRLGGAVPRARLTALQEAELPE